MRNVIPLVKGAKQPPHHICLSVELHSDLAWWKLFAASWNSTALISPLGSAQHMFTSDASGSWGCGAWFKNNRFSLPWIHVHSSLHITVKEMVPIILAALTWGHHWRGGQVMAYCDYSAVVVAINKREVHYAYVKNTVFH